MMGSLRRDRHTRLLDMLDRERDILLAGPIAALGPAVEKREAALAEFVEGGTQPPEPFLLALRSKAERNARLMLASLEGARGAVAALEAGRAASESLRTYTAQGTPREVATRAATRDERA